MGNKTNLETALDRIGGRLGCDLSLDEFRSTQLLLQTDIEIAVEQPEDGSLVRLQAPVCSVSQIDATKLLERALRRNFFDAGLPNAWLAVGFDDRELLLCSTLEAAAIDEFTLSETILRLGDEVSEIRQSLAQNPPALDPLATGQLDPSLGIASLHPSIIVADEAAHIIRGVR